jgi:CheY-like chemotaxis protein
MNHATAPAGRRPTVVAVEQAGTRARPLTVLVIEDSEVIRRVLALVLEAEGYRVYECPTGSRALGLAREVHPDLITLDLALPDLDGRELLHTLRTDKGTRDSPVVVLSAYADVLTSSERASAADVIVKPFDLDDLLYRLRRAIEDRTSR